MNPPLRLRLMTRADLPFADGARALAGWNQSLDDWRRFLALEPDGCFVAEWNGSPAGTAATIVYGADLAWIGMVLVHPDYRGRGIGRALLEGCIEYLHQRAVRCIKLDATPLGKKVYDRLGFKDEWTLTRWVHAGFRPRLAAPDPKLRTWQETDGRLIGRLDSAAFGCSRQRLIRALAEQSRCALVLESEPGRIAGYGLLRNGARAMYLGPVVAASADAGIRLVEGLLAGVNDAAVFWDIPDRHGAAVAWAREQGFTRQRPLTRMVLGANAVMGDPQKQFAMTGPETG